MSQPAFPSPPIQYLPAFVAAAEYNSFKLAAEQLNITPSAVSQQIKSLETRIGLTLFSRQGKELKLTQAGARFYQFAATTLMHYQQGWQGFADLYISKHIRISMTDYVANRIVIPRLAEFVEQTGIQLDIHTSSDYQDLQANTLDAAIRFGTPPWPDHQARLLSEVEIAAVGSPGYLQQHPINNLRDWRRQTLIHTRRSINDWQRVEQVLGYPLNAKQHLWFDSYESAVQASKNGLGLMLASFPISEMDIRSGELQTLRDKRFASEEKFYLITKPNDQKEKRYQQLYNWLQQAFSEL